MDSIVIIIILFLLSFAIVVYDIRYVAYPRPPPVQIKENERIGITHKSTPGRKTCVQLLMGDDREGYTPDIDAL